MNKEKISNVFTWIISIVGLLFILAILLAMALDV